MSWNCPNQAREWHDELFCRRTGDICEPLMKGCVLEGRFRRVEMEGQHAESHRTRPRRTVTAHQEMTGPEQR